MPSHGWLRTSAAGLRGRGSGDARSASGGASSVLSDTTAPTVAPAADSNGGELVLERGVSVARRLELRSAKLGATEPSRYADRGERLRSSWRQSVSRRRALVLLTASIVVAGAPAAVLATRSGSSRAAGAGIRRARVAVARGADVARLPRGARLISIGGPTNSRAIAPGFLGLSLEYSAVPAYAGTDPSALDPVFLQLVRNLSPGQTPVLRIGGDSTDWTWLPVAGMPRPAGVNYSLSAGWIRVAHAIATALGARLILGINLEADSQTVADAEARGLTDGIGSKYIEGLEPGNEPELYAIFNWGVASVKGRARGYDYADFSRDFTRVGEALPAAPLAGPTIGAPEWFGYLGRFLASHPRVAVATLHRYPLQLCYVPPGQPNFPTIPNLLSSSGSTR